MRIATANNRKARRMRAATKDNKEPFCYIEYLKKAKLKHIFDDSKHRWEFKVQPDTYHKRRFDSYAKAVAHLTMRKLNIIEKDDDRWGELTACKIVEGWYTRRGKEVVTRTLELLNERDR